MRSMLSQDARTGCAEASQKIEGQRRGQAAALAGDGLVRRNQERGQGRGGLVGEAIGVSPTITRNQIDYAHKIQKKAKVSNANTSPLT